MMYENIDFNSIDLTQGAPVSNRSVNIILSPNAESM